jgi:hypothetical protein
MSILQISAAKLFSGVPCHFVLHRSSKVGAVTARPRLICLLLFTAWTYRRTKVRQ